MATATLVLSGITLALVLATILLVRAARADNEETRRALRRLERQLGATGGGAASVGDQAAPAAEEPPPADSAPAGEEPAEEPPSEEEQGGPKWREAPVTDIWGQPLRKKPRRR